MQCPPQLVGVNLTKKYFFIANKYTLKLVLNKRPKFYLNVDCEICALSQNILQCPPQPVGVNLAKKRFFYRKSINFKIGIYGNIKRPKFGLNVDC